MRKLNLFFAALLSTFLCVAPALAHPEISRTKNADTYVTFRILNALTGGDISSATGLDCEYRGYADGTDPGSVAYADLTTAEVTNGTNADSYSVKVLAAEDNFDFIDIRCKSSSTNAVAAYFTINTKYGSTSAADVLAQVAAGLNTAVPGSPTADSINARIKGLSDSTGTFQSGSSTTDLVLSATETANDISGAIISIDSGLGLKDFCVVTAYNTSTKHATCSPALTNAPSSGDKYTIVVNGGVVDTLTSAVIASIKSAVNEIFNTDTMAELSACPTAGATLAQKITYLFEFFRHKMTATSSVQTLFKDNGSTSLCTNTQGDSAGTYTRGEFN